jgi:hypothetical protein
MKGKKEGKKTLRISMEIWLVLIFLAAFSFRLAFSLSTSGFTGDESYYNLRQIENIEKTGKPIVYDALSYSGREFAVIPGMHYFLAGISLLFSRWISEEVLFKIILNFFSATAAIFAYAIIFELSHSKSSSLIAAFATAFTPIFMGSTVNSISSFSISIPLNLLLIYFFIKSEYDMPSVIKFMGVLMLAALTDALVIAVLVGILLYILMINVEEMPESPARIELIIFSIVFVFWVDFIVFKDAFLTHGISMIWKNIPLEISSRYFTRINLINIVYSINIIPFLAGIYVIYNYTIREKKKNIYLFAGIVTALLVFLWLKLIELWVGLMAIGIFFAILIGYFYHSISSYLAKTKIAGKTLAISMAFLVLFISSTAVNSWQYAQSASANSFSKNEEDALKFLSGIDCGAVVSAPSSGMMIEYFSKKKTVMDSQFLMIPKINERYADVKSIYQTPYETNAIGTMDNYDADIIYLSDREKSEFGINGITYSGDKRCFELLYNDSVIIYRKLCRLGSA